MSSLFHNSKNPVKEPSLQLKPSPRHVCSIIRNCLSWEQPDLRASQLLSLAHGQERESWRVSGCPKVVLLLSFGVAWSKMHQARDLPSNLNQGLCPMNAAVRLYHLKYQNYSATRDVNIHLLSKQRVLISSITLSSCLER